MRSRGQFTRFSLLLAGWVMLGLSIGPFGSRAGDFADARRRMMEEVHRDVARNSHVLGRGELSVETAAAMAGVERHLFVPAELRPNAYANRPLPIGHGQTISQPTIVALMTDLMHLAPTDTVLEIGTGSGYQAAVLSEIVPRGFVHTIEIVPSLVVSARSRLLALGFDNIDVHEGDGYLGLPEAAPFAGVMVTAAAPEIPQPLIDQLAPGGRLVMPVGERDGTQWLTVLTKNAAGEIREKVVLPVRFVPLVRGRNAPAQDR